MPRLSVAEREVDRDPDRCPCCHHAITPQALTAVHGSGSKQTPLQVVYHCPNTACHSLFIAYFEEGESRGGPKILAGCAPVSIQKRVFSETLTGISPSYCEIANEAHVAEQRGLKQICGIGYRKALEFLIKDYLIALDPAERTAIEGEFLGTCIAKRVQNTNLRNVAQRATWLGNDEAHYKRKWVDKDLSDLKHMIDLTCYWIEELTKVAIADMP
jgi:hypothetical protein